MRRVILYLFLTYSIGKTKNIQIWEHENFRKNPAFLIISPKNRIFFHDFAIFDIFIGILSTYVVLWVYLHRRIRLKHLQKDLPDFSKRSRRITLKSPFREILCSTSAKLFFRNVFCYDLLWSSIIWAISQIFGKLFYLLSLFLWTSYRFLTKFCHFCQVDNNHKVRFFARDIFIKNDQCVKLVILRYISGRFMEIDDFIILWRHHMTSSDDVIKKFEISAFDSIECIFWIFNYLLTIKSCDI